MFLFIAMLFFIVMSIIYYAIFERIKHGHTLNRVQTNVAASYITLSRRIGKTIYRVLGLAFIVFLAVNALAVGAWIVAAVMFFYIYISLRTQRLIDHTGFEAVDQAGVKDPKGAYLQPIT